MDSMRIKAQKMMPSIMALNKNPTMGMKNNRQPKPGVSNLTAYAQGGSVKKYPSFVTKVQGVKKYPSKDFGRLSSGEMDIVKGLTPGKPLDTDAYMSGKTAGINRQSQAKNDSALNAYANRGKDYIKDKLDDVDVAISKKIGLTERAKNKESFRMGLKEEGYAKGGKAMARHNKLMHPGQKSKLMGGGMVSGYAEGKKVKKPAPLEPFKPLTPADKKKIKDGINPYPGRSDDMGMKKGGKVKGDKKKVMGTVGEAKALMNAMKKVRRPATPMPGARMAGLGMAPPMAPQMMAPPMKRGGKVRKYADGGEVREARRIAKDVSKQRGDATSRLLVGKDDSGRGPASVFSDSRIQKDANLIDKKLRDKYGELVYDSKNARIRKSDEPIKRVGGNEYAKGGKVMKRAAGGSTKRHTNSKRG